MLGVTISLSDADASRRPRDRYNAQRVDTQGRARRRTADGRGLVPSCHSLGAGVVTEFLAEAKGTDAGRQLSKPSPGPVEPWTRGVVGALFAIGRRETVLLGLVDELCLPLVYEPEALFGVPENMCCSSFRASAVA